jgi:predicted peroxiredoxin
MSERPRICIYAKGDTYEQLHTMVGLVATAASMNWEAHVFLTYGALYRYVHAEMSEAEVGITTPVVKKAYQRGIDAGRIPDLDELLDEARELGGERIKLYGCTTSIKLLHLTPKVPEQVDSLLAHGSFMQLAVKPGAKMVVT